MDRIFVSYRRGPGASEAAGRIADRVAQRAGHDRLFMDVDTVRPGMDFVDAIEEAVATCEVLIAVIDPAWTGKRRIDDPGDYVRLEVATALRRGVRVIPVLVLGASMPAANDLPPDLSSLSRRQALVLSHERFNSDVEVLLEELGLGSGRRRGAPNQSSPSVWSSSRLRAAGSVVLLLGAVATWMLALSYERGLEGKDTFGWRPYVTDIYVVPLRITTVVTLGVLAIFLIITRPRR